MSEEKFRYGPPVPLLVKLEGFPDGRLIKFKIVRLNDGKRKKVGFVNGRISGGKGLAEWVPHFKNRKDNLPLKKTIAGEHRKEYYYVVKIDDQVKKSKKFIFTYPIEIFLTDKNGTPIEGAKCKITFSDDTWMEAVFKNGSVKVADAPSGKFKIELEEYNFVEKTET